MLYYEAATQQLHAIDFREVAPMAASYNMYEGLEPTASAIGESCMQNDKIVLPVDLQNN